jgi:soluble lytic murein transglycosylase-like protein
MARWTNEDAFDTPIRVAAGNYGVPFEVIKAVIGRESAFRPTAYRAEPAIGDGSIGLMQILYGTARGEGYTGPIGDPSKLTGLYDPATNVAYGVSYLAKQIARAGNIPGGISAYNGGYRPEIGFGAPITRSGVVICLARDTAGKCIKQRTVPVGEYANQEHVNYVLQNLAYFQSKIPPPSNGVKPPPLTSANQHNVESEADRRVSRTPDRFTWDSFVAVLKKALGLP